MSGLLDHFGARVDVRDEYELVEDYFRIEDGVRSVVDMERDLELFIGVDGPPRDEPTGGRSVLLIICGVC